MPTAVNSAHVADGFSAVKMYVLKSGSMQKEAMMEPMASGFKEAELRASGKNQT